MSRTPLTSLLACLATLGGAALWAGERLRPLDRVEPEAAEARIEWKESWQATYEANKKRWADELQQAVKDKKLREQFLSLRLIRLLEELVPRYPDDAARRLAAYGEIADRLTDAGCRGRANHYLRRITEEFPGVCDAAAAALQRILNATVDQRHEIEDGEEWAGYAVGHLAALNRAGYLSEGHPALEVTWRAALDLATENGRLWEASRALERLEAIVGRSRWWRGQEAELLLAAGRREDALRLLDELAAEGADGRVNSLLQELGREAAGEGPEFPRRWAVESRWELVKAAGAAPDAGVVHSLLAQAARSDGLVPSGKGAQASLWTAADRELVGLAPGALGPLRQLQQKEAARFRIPDSRFQIPIRNPQSAIRNEQALFDLWRRYPWAVASQSALAEFAEDALRQGHAGLAFRAFQDVLTHSADGAARARAQAGLRLAISDFGFRISDFNPQSAIRNPQSGPPVLVAPPAVPWAFASGYPGRREWSELVPAPPARFLVAGERLFLAGPDLLACYGDAGRAPLWWRAPCGARAGADSARPSRPWATMPGPFVPAVADDRVFVRWGLDPSGQFMAGVAAFDAATGERLWSTQGQPWWENLSPITDPAVADGRVYFLAVRATPTSVVPVWLVCLDAAEGTLLWQRFLASSGLGLRRAPGSPHLAAEQIDLVHFGNAPLVHLGAVYCTTNLGFVARCDALDGLVEWARPYPRVRLGRNLADAVRREGATPVAVGGAVLFAPRDYTGVFALDQATGAPLWDAPFVPSQQVIGKAGDALLLRDGEHLAALEAGSGALRWDRRLPGGIAARAALVGREVCVLSRGGLIRIAADTGVTLGRSDWPGKEPVRDLAVRSGQFIALTDRLTTGGREPRKLHIPARQPLGLPLRRAWTLRRPDPTLWLPPAGARDAGAKLDGRLFLFSQGVLECVSKGADGSVHWARAVQGGVREVAWAGGLMLLAYPRRVLALDAATGDFCWETAVSFDAKELRLFGEYLFLAGQKQAREAAVIRLAAGELLWSRAFAELFGRARFNVDAAAWDGKQLHLFSSRLQSQREGPAEALVRPSDGAIVGVRPFPREGEPWPLQLAFDGGAAFLITKDKVLHEYTLADGSLRPYQAPLGQLDPRRIQRFAVDEPWIHLYWDKGYDAAAEKHWLLRRGEPAFLLRRKNWAERRGDFLYETPEGTGALIAFDLRAGKSTEYRCPQLPDLGSVGSVVHHHATGERLFAVSTPQTGRALTLRVDGFNGADGAHLDAQGLWDIEVRNNQVAWAEDAVLVTDPAGLHCFVAASPAERQASPVQVAYRLPQPLPPDGSVLASGGRDVVRLNDARDARGSLHVAHDESNLYVAVRYRDPAPAPWAPPPSGGADSASGDWLELGLKTNLGGYRWAAGLDRVGRLRLIGLDATPVPLGARARMQHDPASQLMTCELTLPWKSIFRAGEDWRRIGLWAVAWGGHAPTGGRVPLFAWGRERPEERSPAAAQDTLYLDARTREQGDAIAAVIEELPDLPVSLELFKQDAEMRSASRAELVERYWGFIERHPSGPSAEQLLLDVARAAAQGRGGSRLDPILQRAAHANVPEAVRQRVAWELGSCLSQWAYLDTTKDLRSLLIELNSGMGFDEWGHRAYWGKPVANWIVPPCEMGSISDLAEGKWQELRIPLFLVALHDKPICGINFCQQGSPRIVWDRSAVAAGGKEAVFVEDETPKGTTRGTWDWVDQPRHSGAKAHTHDPPAGPNDVKSHTLSELDEPVVAHLSPPLDRPYLSQWVYLDPADPPATVALSLHDGRGWAFRALWGRRTLRGRAMGPLPKPGQWQELRLPLAWTPFLTRSIAGLAWSHIGGKVVWDRTALVAGPPAIASATAGGKEQVLLDEPPPPRLRAAGASTRKREWQSWWDGPEGETRPVPGKVGLGMLCDGHTGYVRVPHSPELDPPEFTVETWVYLDTFALGSDTKQWLVNKNGHAWVDGFFGLLIYRDKAVADINIGGQKEGRFEAWSEEGTLKLKQWHHLAMTYDGAALKLYRDAELVAQAEVNKPRTPGRGPLYIGRWAFGRNFFEGTLDEVRLYRRALSAAEIRERHGRPDVLAPQVADAVAGHWGFDAEAAPADPLAEWQWVDQPVKSGRKAHTDRPSSGPCGHAAWLLAEPITQHLPFECSRAVAFLQAQIPRLGPGDESWRLFGDLLQLELPHPQRRIELNKWFLSAFPGHPKAVEVLGNLLDACKEADDPEPIDRVLVLTKEFHLPADVLYHYHRRYARTPREFLRSWQLLGPFAGQGEGWGLDTPHPPETDGVKLDRGYPGIGGDVRWRETASEGSYMNLKFFLGPAENALAYAAAWVYSDKERKAVVAIGSDDRCKLWLNGKVVLTGRNAAYAAAGEFIAPVALAAGWNEVLLKVTQGTGEWGFYFELLDEFARKAPLGVRVASAPHTAK